jgi:integrase
MVRKRANGEGSVSRRPDGRWMGRITLPNGRRKTLYGPTKDETAKMVRALVHQQDAGVPIPTEDPPLRDFLQTWLAAVEHTLRPTTYRRYEQVVRTDLIPELGGVRLSKLNPAHVHRLHGSLLNRGLSTTSVHHVHAVLHRALNQGVRWGYVLRNAASLVDAPRMERHEFRTLSSDEARAFLKEAEGDRHHALYALALTTGMRQGELLALQWRNVDLKRATLHIRGSLERRAKTLAIGQPKTRTSRRQVRLTATAVEALRQHRLRQNEERLRVGAAWEDNDLVFCTEVGTPASASNLLNRSFRPLLKRAGIERIRFHDLRHTAATLLLEQGLHPKLVSEMLGHSTIAITLDLYSHVTESMHKQAADAMDAILRSSKVE